MDVAKHASVAPTAFRDALKMYLVQELRDRKTFETRKIQASLEVSYLTRELKTCLADWQNGVRVRPHS